VSSTASAPRPRPDGTPATADPEAAVDAVVAFLEDLEDESEDDEPPLAAADDV
jgi:hypothetical protein